MQSKTSSRCTSALAVALVVMSAAALDTGFTNAADAEKFASIDSVIGGLNHGRRLQGETETEASTAYCCPFERRAYGRACVKRGTTPWVSSRRPTICPLCIVGKAKRIFSSDMRENLARSTHLRPVAVVFGFSLPPVLRHECHPCGINLSPTSLLSRNLRTTITRVLLQSAAVRALKQETVTARPSLRRETPHPPNNSFVKFCGSSSFVYIRWFFRFFSGNADDQQKRPR